MERDVAFHAVQQADGADRHSCSRETRAALCTWCGLDLCGRCTMSEEDEIKVLGRLNRAMICYVFGSRGVLVPQHGARLVTYSYASEIEVVFFDDGDERVSDAFFATWRRSNIYEFRASARTRERRAAFLREDLRSIVGVKDFRQVERRQRCNIPVDFIDDLVELRVLEKTGEAYGRSVLREELLTTPEESSICEAFLRCFRFAERL